MNKILRILFCCLLILEAESTFSRLQPSTTTHHKRRKKKKSRRTLKHKKLRNKKRPRRKRLRGRFKHPRHLNSKRKLSRRLKQKKHAASSRRLQRMLEDLPPDSISINYAELKVRRMLARSELPEKNRIEMFNKIMKSLDRYEENGHVTIPDMELVVSKEISNRC